jgi:large subunit ribosomal protein L29
MRTREINELSKEEIAERVDKTRKEILELRFQHAARKLESPAKLKTARRQLARLLTIGAEKAKK